MNFAGIPVDRINVSSLARLGGVIVPVQVAIGRRKWGCVVCRMYARKKRDLRHTKTCAQKQMQLELENS